MTEIYDEKQLCTRLAAPETRREAFGQMVNLYKEQLYWQIRRIVLVHDDADDLLQEVFLKAWNSLDTFRSDSKLSTWLHRIAINISIDFVRHKKAIDMVNADAVNNGLSIADRLTADEYFDGNEIQAALQEAIAQLPEKQRAIFNMRYFDEMKYSDISDILGTSVGALKASYHIAVKKISEYFHSLD